MKISQLLSWKGEINRKHYLTWGIILFAIKYNLDRLIALSFDRNWYIIDYYLSVDELSNLEAGTSEFTFYLILLISSLPFLWSGTVLCLKRIRNTDLSPVLVLLFFIPYLNFILFIVLASLPEKKQKGESKENYLKRMLPDSKLGSALISIGVAVIITFILAFLFVEQMGNYGWSLFVGLPFLMGYLSVYLYGRRNPISFKEASMLSLTVVLVFCGTTFILAFEGIICLAMGFPILFVVAWIGATIAYAIQDHQKAATYSFPIIFVLIAGLIEAEIESSPPVHSVSTSVTIKADKQSIWNELVAFSEIEPPKEFLFKTGIAYPTHAEIIGTGIGAIRECHFTTGYFKEPITIWNEPELLRFDVAQQPPPMTEWSFHEKLNVPHLDGYFRSVEGQFKLIQKPNGTILLEGTTWYTHDIWPGFYWKLWSDHILHKIHFRVLNHIKKKVEQK